MASKDTSNKNDTTTAPATTTTTTAAEHNESTTDGSTRSLASRILGAVGAAGGGGAAESDPNNNNNGTNNTNENNETPPTNEEKTPTQEEEEEESETINLTKTLKLRGYIVLFASSAINFVASYESDNTNSFNVVPANEGQRTFAMANAGVVGGWAFVAIVAHCDRYTCLRGIWMKLFKPKACFEKFLLFFLVIWCAAATWINTSIEGIAGDGNQQYDIYFTTWINFLTSVWTVEQYYVCAGYSSLYTFMSSWPHRAPAWIALFVSSFVGFLFVIDLNANYKEGTKGTPAVRRMFEDVPQWQWVVTGFTFCLSFVVAFVFSVVELFRVSRAGVTSQKTKWENMTEGGLVLFLVVAWMLCVAIVTTPGGLGSLVGNAYFLTWASTLVAIETFLWWVRDWRRDIAAAAARQHEEYRKAKQAALARGMMHSDDDWDEVK